MTDDEKYDAAKQVLTQIQRVSPSAIQRRIRVGWTEACRLIDRMEAEGFVTPEKSDHTRDLVAPNVQAHGRGR